MRLHIDHTQDDADSTTCMTSDIVKDWSIEDQNYFAQTQTISLTLFAIVAGALVFYIRRYKWLLFGGLLVRLLGVGL